MAITDEEALAWAEEAERATGAEPQTNVVSRGDEEGDGEEPDGAGAAPELAGSAPVHIPETVVVPAGTGADVAPPAVPAARRELTVVLTLTPTEGEDPTWRALYTIGGEHEAYPVQHSLVAGDPAWAAAQIPRLLAETEARWREQPALPKATSGTSVAPGARPPATSPAKDAPGTGAKTGAKGKTTTGGTPAAAGGDNGLLAAALLQGTAATGAPTGPAASTPPVPAAPQATPGVAAETVPASPPQAKGAKQAPPGQMAMELFG